jgi:uncharacterized membrane protein
MSRCNTGICTRRLRASQFLGLFPILTTFSALPIALSRKRWLEIWGARARAWDGTGHYATAQIYDQTIFPDTFGWTHAYFGGMPFPNFYPPLFYWLVGLLHHTHRFSFNAAFKLVMVLPVLLMTASLWMQGYTLSNRSRLCFNRPTRSMITSLWVTMGEWRIRVIIMH